MKQLYIGLEHELIVDNFAGGGGASLGIELAVKRPVDIAVNHDPEAVAMHMANHPQTRHYCENVWDVDPVKATGGKPVGLAWFSPDCKHFSKAKGGKPVSKKIRGLAWVVIRWAKAVQPRVIMLENVEEFQDWGPLLEDGTPCPVRKGLTFRRWKKQLENLGYQVECRELRACDYGAPTIRKRLFVIARRDGLPIVWPAPTHGKGLKPYRTAAECIDWSLPCPSIFERELPLAEATMRRIAKGIYRYVINAKEPYFVMTNTTGHPGAKVREPLRTVTTGGHHALVSPTLIQTGYGERPGQEPRVPGLDKPLGTVVAGGQKHALVSAFLAQHNGGMVGHDARKPMSTITQKGAQQQVVAAHMINLKGADRRMSAADQPAPTVTAGGYHIGVVTTQMEKISECTSSAQSTDRDEADGGATRRDDLETRSPGQSTARNANKTKTRREKVQKRLFDGQDGMDGENLSAFRAHRGMGDIERADPEGTGYQSQGRSEVEQPSMESGTGHSLGKSQARLQDGFAQTSERLDEGHATEVMAFLQAYYGTDQDPQLREPLHTVTTKDRFGLVTVHGEDYVIADIGMRMLQPRELYRAQGFPDSYQIDATIKDKPLSKTAQVRMCGNSVSPVVATALVRANFQHELQTSYLAEAATG